MKEHLQLLVYLFWIMLQLRACSCKCPKNSTTEWLKPWSVMQSLDTKHDNSITLNKTAYSQAPTTPSTSSTQWLLTSRVCFTKKPTIPTEWWSKWLAFHTIQRQHHADELFLVSNDHGSDHKHRYTEPKWKKNVQSSSLLHEPALEVQHTKSVINGLPLWGWCRSPAQAPARTQQTPDFRDQCLGLCTWGQSACPHGPRLHRHSSAGSLFGALFRPACKCA